MAKKKKKIWRWVTEKYKMMSSLTGDRTKGGVFS